MAMRVRDYELEIEMGSGRAAAGSHVTKTCTTIRAASDLAALRRCLDDLIPRDGWTRVELWRRAESTKVIVAFLEGAVR